MYRILSRTFSSNHHFSSRLRTLENKLLSFQPLYHHKLQLRSEHPPNNETYHTQLQYPIQVGNKNISHIYALKQEMQFLASKIKNNTEIDKDSYQFQFFADLIKYLSYPSNHAIQSMQIHNIAQNQQNHQQHNHSNLPADPNQLPGKVLFVEFGDNSTANYSFRSILDSIDKQSKQVVNVAPQDAAEYTDASEEGVQLNGNDNITSLYAASPLLADYDPNFMFNQLECSYAVDVYKLSDRAVFPLLIGAKQFNCINQLRHRCRGLLRGGGINRAVSDQQFLMELVKYHPNAKQLYGSSGINRIFIGLVDAANRNNHFNDKLRHRTCFKIERNDHSIAEFSYLTILRYLQGKVRLSTEGTIIDNVLQDSLDTTSYSSLHNSIQNNEINSSPKEHTLPRNLSKKKAKLKASF
jgi:hypothetical protein